MKNSFFFFLFPLFFFACSSPQATVPEQQQIKVERVNTGLILGRPDALMLKDSLLFIADARADSLFYAVDLHHYTFTEKGAKGQGPNEYLHFDNFTRLGSSIGFYDRLSRTYNCIHTKEGSQKVALEKSVGFDSLHYHVVPTAFDYFVATGPYTTGRFKIVDLEGKVIGTRCEQPYRDEEERRVSELYRAMAYQGRLTTSPDGKHLVHAIATSPIISFYRLTPQKEVELIKTHADEYPEYRPQAGEKTYASAMSRANKLGYMDVFATDNYVYALFSGRSTLENGMTAFLGNQIRVYNWEGELIKELVCDNDLRSICVSTDEKTLYAVGIIEDYELIKADL